MALRGDGGAAVDRWGGERGVVHVKVRMITPGKKIPQDFWDCFVLKLLSAHLKSLSGLLYKAC